MMWSIYYIVGNYLYSETSQYNRTAVRNRNVYSRHRLLKPLEYFLNFFFNREINVIVLKMPSSKDFCYRDAVNV